jgi:pimeloyl-ACP methyl ester carboxylesterase
MPYVKTDDGLKLYYEQTGAGEPVVFVHEFAGDCRSWEPQMRYFGRRYTCIAYNARGYPPSDVPENDGMFSQERACDDILVILDSLGLRKAHIVGLSMGGFATLHFGLRHPDRAHSLVVAGCGYGAEKDKQEQFRAEAEATAKLIDQSTSGVFAAKYAEGPTRVQFRNKDPRGWEEFREQLATLSRKGAALTMRGVQKTRPSLFELEQQMRKLTVPTLIMTGDEDEPCLIPAIFMKRTIASAALTVLPNSGHTINLEEPDAFNRAVDEFLIQVTAGRWPTHEPGSAGGSILGIDAGG